MASSKFYTVLLISSVVALGVGALAPAVAAEDPDPTPSGDARCEGPSFGDAAIGTVSPDDHVDTFAFPEDEPTKVRIQTLTPTTEFKFEIWSPDCEFLSQGFCDFESPISFDECGAAGTVFEAVANQEAVAGHVELIPAGGYLTIQASGHTTAYAVTLVDQ